MTGRSVQKYEYNNADNPRETLKGPRNISGSSITWGVYSRLVLRLLESGDCKLDVWLSTWGQLY